MRFKDGVNRFAASQLLQNEINGDASVAVETSNVTGFTLEMGPGGYAFDLARKPVFLHDNSVATLDDLFNPNRGANAPHPFYVANGSRRADLIQFLRSMDTNTDGGRR